jgi:hypothetical protein
MQNQRADSLIRMASMFTPVSASRELKLLFPEINKVEIGEMVSVVEGQARLDTVMLVMINWQKAQPALNSQQVNAGVDPTKVQEYEGRIRSYMSSRFKRDSVRVSSVL